MLQKKLLLFSTAFAVILTDQFSKFLIIKKLCPASEFFIFDFPHLSAKLLCAINDRLSFSIFLPQPLIIILIFMILAGLFYLFYQKTCAQNYFQSFLLTVIISSAISNLFDRIYHGGVIDFLTFKIFNYQWAIFNLADIYLVIAIILFLIKEFQLNRPPTPKN